MTHAFVTLISQSTGIIFFMLIFFGVLTYALWPKNRDRFNSAAELPLKED